MNGHNKLVCFITLHWKGLPETNALAFCAYLQVTKKIKFVNDVPGVVLTIIHHLYKSQMGPIS